MTEAIRILLVDDHSQVHRSLSVMHDTHSDLELVAHASNGEEAVRQCDEHQPDVVLMDVVMPTMNGIEATRIIHERYPQIKILVLSSFQDEDSVQEMMRAGAAGYVLKNSSLEEIVNSIRAVHTGKNVFSAEVTHALFAPRTMPEAPHPDYGLSARELEVLAQMVRGSSNKQIAQALTVSEATVKFHVRGILAKLNVSGRVEAVALALEKKLVQ